MVELKKGNVVKKYGMIYKIVYAGSSSFTGKLVYMNSKRIWLGEREHYMYGLSELEIPTLKDFSKFLKI